MVISNRAKNIQESATLASAQRARELIAQGIDVIQLTLGEPDFSTPQHIKQAAIQAIKEGNSDHYTNATGILPLKQAIVDFHKQYDGVTYQPQDVVVGTGAKHILFVLCQALLNKDDKVIIPTPYWVSYSEQVKLAGGVPLFVETTFEQQYKVTVEQLNALDLTHVKAIIINSPNNPTGSVYTKEELLQIGEWAVQHDLFIISDEIYYRLVYGDTQAISMASLSESIKSRTIIVNGVAKSYAMTGWRIGYALSTNKDIIGAMGQIISHETSNLTAVSQYAGVAAYSGTQEPVEEMRKVFEERLHLFYNLISQIEGFKLTKPQGAFYLFPNVKEAARLTGYDSVKEFADALLTKAHVAVVSGDAFGMDDCIRLSYAGDSEQLIEAARRIARFIDEHKRNI
ncbi:pyridoxal phosphate-dependent aminotransferase [Carnobacteriaceae bacterium zg-84]|uniref:pyridoxal phosphate-dependent aminotransferase n=1 Tax=Granulicatella sp. zg-84 TaxID=2678503 RepID=UPI0013C0C1C3|nr:pyridoxal phosphate-dependent aminotransferase [Granulicatella sp. zg-84]NEW66318.1 aminotransferase class I/II-fold pyridoxal phosphate-dependent enzyme [Granulicatella sp. zg-84]QMI85383.1 pyridoxal phosphate-dependent aminotransferase [Carnobacteriaceae bacterium zg-84]